MFHNLTIFNVTKAIYVVTSFTKRNLSTRFERIVSLWSYYRSYVISFYNDLPRMKIKMFCVLPRKLWVKKLYFSSSKFRKRLQIIHFFFKNYEFCSQISDNISENLILSISSIVISFWFAKLMTVQVVKISSYNTRIVSSDFNRKYYHQNQIFSNIIICLCFHAIMF